MKFNVPGKSLQQQLQSVSKVINSKNALSILDNFLLRVEGGKLYITGSDGENVLTSSLEIFDPDSDGAIAVSAKMLLDITKEVGGQPLVFNVNDLTCEVDIEFLTGHFNFMGIDPAEYPNASSMDDDTKTLVIPAEMVKKGIDKTIFAVSAEPIRPIMTGICWDIHNDDITFVSSDTHKLVRYVSKMASPGLEANFIMPAKPANILRNIISANDEEVYIKMDAKSATFKVGNYCLSCRFIKGNYPPYNRVIPTDNPFKVVIDRQSLLNALRRVSLFASKASSLVKYVVKDHQIELSGQDIDYSTSAKEFVECQYDGNEMVMGFNAVYAIEVLSNMNGDTVIIELSDPARPGVYLPLQQEDNEDLTIIQMPIQVME